MSSDGPESTGGARYWALWFLGAFCLNVGLDLGLGLSWQVRWAIVLVVIPAAMLAVATWRGRRGRCRGHL